MSQTSPAATDSAELWKMKQNVFSQTVSHIRWPTDLPFQKRQQQIAPLLFLWTQKKAVASDRKVFI